MSTKGALLTIGVLLFFVSLSLLIPARWLGVQPVQKKSRGLDLSYSLQKSDIVIPSSWNELANASIPQADIKELEATKPDPKVIENLNDPNNLTASFSKNLYVASTYLAKDPNNNAQIQKEMLDTLIAQEATKIVPTTYDYKDLNLAKTDTKEFQKIYGNTVAPLLRTLITEQSFAENLASIQNYTESKDEKDLTLLIKDYQKVNKSMEKLASVAVPPSAALYHLSALNNVAAYRDSLYNLSLTASDPIRATIFINKYVPLSVQAVRVPRELATYFNLKNIVFTAKEPGYLFIVGYTE